MASTAYYQCRNKNCTDLFLARTADRARGWAQFCSKSCKAVNQEDAKKVWQVLKNMERK